LHVYPIALVARGGKNLPEVGKRVVASGPRAFEGLDGDRSNHRVGTRAVKRRPDGPAQAVENTGTGAPLLAQGILGLGAQAVTTRCNASMRARGMQLLDVATADEADTM